MSQQWYIPMSDDGKGGVKFAESKHGIRVYKSMETLAKFMPWQGKFKVLELNIEDGFRPEARWLD